MSAQKTRLLVTGASGYLGRYLVPRLADGPYRILAAFARNLVEPPPVGEVEPVPLDLSRPGEAEETIRRLAPDAVVHAAAVNPGGGEEAWMHQVNVEGSRRVARAATQLGARLVHISSDRVHGGDRAPYGEDDSPTPIEPYGRSKAEAEGAVLEACPGAALVRTSLIYGVHEMDRGTRGFAERLAAGETLRLFRDTLRQPVWVETLALAIRRLLEIDYAGPLNVAGSQVFTREEFGRRMLSYWRIPDHGRIESVSAREMGLPVPLDLTLHLDRAREVLGIPLPGVDEVLAASGGAGQARPQGGELS